LQITGGKFKGQKLFSPPAKAFEIRPLRTRIRKALFDILGEDLEGLKVLDLFAGTGALGIEALSRGADFAVFVDASPLAIELIQKNLKKLGLEAQSHIYKLKLPEGFSILKKHLTPLNLKFHLVFITPPYEKELSFKTLEALPEEILEEEALIIVEERSEIPFPEKVKDFELLDARTYGETALYFYTLSKASKESKGSKEEN